ncbi:MAG: Dps family protein, partial [Comamonas sp.]
MAKETKKTQAKAAASAKAATAKAVAPVKAVKAASKPAAKAAPARATNTARMPIKIGISAKDREDIAAGLSRLLADTYTLYLTTHNFHWNVTGPMF